MNTSTHDEVKRDQRGRKVAEKVHKLLALAESAKGTPEGDNAALQARKLMDAYALSEGDVSEAGNPMTMIEVKLGNGVWRRDLMLVVSQYTGCCAFFSLTPRCALIHGRRSDVEVAEYLYDYLQAEIGRRCDAFITQLRKRLALDPRGAAFSRGVLRENATKFCNGAVLGLGVRLQEMRNGEETTDAAGFALFLARIAAADAYARELLGGVEPAQIPIDKRRQANREGVAAGKTMPIHDGVRAERNERRLLGAERTV